MMNVLVAFFLAHTQDRFALFQVASAFLNMLVFLPCCLMLPALGLARRPRILPLVALFAFSPVVMENATYTWTKMLTAFFVVLAVLFYARQAGTHMDPRTLRQIGDWHPVLLPPILFLNTAVLLLSSLTMERARLHIFREIDVLEEWLGLGRPALRRTLPWIALTLVLGLMFLGGQAMAWKQLTAQGFRFDRWATPASYFFYIITGLHAAHLIIGVLALLFCLCALTRFKRVESRQIAVDSTAWFWHTMGFAWLVLFGLLVLGQ